MNHLKKNWTLYFLLVFSVVLPTIVQTTISKELNIWIFSLSIVMGVVYSFGWVMFLKKNLWGIYLYIMGIILNIILDYFNAVYGDLLLRLLYMLPIQFVVLKNWKKQLGESGTITYHSWTWKETITNIIVFTLIVAFISLNLKFINKVPVLNLLFEKNDPYIVLDAMGVVGNIFGQYHLSKEHLGWFGMNAIADGSLTIMWLLIFILTGRIDAIVLSLANFSYVVIVFIQYFEEQKVIDSVTHESFDIVEEE